MLQLVMVKIVLYILHVPPSGDGMFHFFLIQSELFSEPWYSAFVENLRRWSQVRDGACRKSRPRNFNT